MAGGYGTTKEMFTDRFAEVFAAAGLAVLLYDHRSFGASEGEQRQEIDPWRHVEDLRHAITDASSLPALDPSRIDVWGSSYNGGPCLGGGSPRSPRALRGRSGSHQARMAVRPRNAVLWARPKPHCFEGSPTSACAARVGMRR